MTKPGRNSPLDCTAHLSMIHRLAIAAAGSVDPEEIVAAAWAELPLLVGADTAALVLFHAKKLWSWSKPGDRELAEAVRARLLIRFERGPGWKVCASNSPRSLRRSHLSLVPKSNAPAQPDDTTLSVHEVTMTVGSDRSGLLRVERAIGNPFTEHEQQTLSTSAVLLGLAFGRLQAQQALQDVALRDPLTGVLARRAIEEPLQRELKMGLRYGTPASLLVLDLDYFTTVNDRLGHAAGDNVLKEVAALIQENVRAVDAVGRFGGEQFAVVLPHTDVEMAETLAERIRADIERHAFAVKDGQVRITVSIGIASLHDVSITNVDRWIAAADAALSEAKAQGRNRVATHHACNPAPAQAAVLRVA
jgi:diguanylate cyclase (GGDEF)-like protein